MAIDEGMITLRIDGTLKVLEGLTTAEEILSITSEEERGAVQLLPGASEMGRSEEHTSELQSLVNLVCRLLLEKKKPKKKKKNQVSVNTHRR